MVVSGGWFCGEPLDEGEDVVRFLARLLHELIVPLIFELFFARCGVRGRTIIGIKQVQVLPNFQSRDEVRLLKICPEIAIL